MGGIKVTLVTHLITMLLCFTIYGMDETTDFGSLRVALEYADKKNSKFIMHQFDIAYPEDLRKSFLSCAFSVDQQIIGHEMDAMSRDAIQSMRFSKRDLDNVYDYIVTDERVASYNARIWDESALNFQLMTESDADHSVIFIYNIAEDTYISLQKHIEHIERLREDKKAKVIVNVAKKCWYEVYKAIHVDNQEDIIIIGTIPSPFYLGKSFFFISGSVVIALLALLHHISNAHFSLV
jgi:hypothetical protein